MLNTIISPNVSLPFITCIEPIHIIAILPNSSTISDNVPKKIPILVLFSEDFKTFKYLNSVSSCILFSRLYVFIVSIPFILCITNEVICELFSKTSLFTFFSIPLKENTIIV